MVSDLAQLEKQQRIVRMPCVYCKMIGKKITEENLVMSTIPVYIIIVVLIFFCYLLNGLVLSTSFLSMS